MKFSGHTIPEAIFTLTRDRMRAVSSFTPPDMRAYIVERAAVDLAAVTFSDVNKRIIAERVMRAVIKELVAAGELAQLKRGVWMKKSIIDNAA